MTSFHPFVTSSMGAFAALPLTAPCLLQEETISDLLSSIERLNSLKQSSVFPTLKVGDSVERGPDWKWGPQDQSPGNPRYITAVAADLA
jgi:hypothetical protein